MYRLSMETGLTQQTIHAWYNLKKPAVPSIATLEIICEAFGITLADFFTESNLIEVTPQMKEFYDNWCALSSQEREALNNLTKIILDNKR